MSVSGLDAALCKLPLPYPVRLGGVEYSTRDYAVLRLTTDDGLEGFSYSYTRGTPLIEALLSVAPRVIGADPRNRRTVSRDLLGSNPPGRTSLVRAVSMLDTALWDLAAKAAGLPLHQLLGGNRERVPVMPVCGYYADRRGDEEIADEMGDLVKRGFTHVKLIGGARDPGATRRLISACRDAVGPDALLSVDLHYSLADLLQAERIGKVLDEFDVYFLEDPFLPSRSRDIVRLGGRIRTPLAAGEDVSDVRELPNLLEAVSVLRIDPSTCGGISAALTGLELAAVSGAAVIPHVFTHTSAQLAGPYPQITFVEAILPETGADPICELLEPLQIEDGEVVLGTDPGIGLGFDWTKVVDAADQVVAPAA